MKAETDFPFLFEGRKYRIYKPLKNKITIIPLAHNRALTDQQVERLFDRVQNLFKGSTITLSEKIIVREMVLTEPKPDHSKGFQTTLDDLLY